MSKGCPAFKRVAIAHAIVHAFFGLGGIFAPEMIMATYLDESTINQTGIVMTRWFGVFVLVNAIQQMFAPMFVTESKKQKVYALGWVVSQLVGTIYSVFLTPQVSGQMNNMVWSTVGIYVLFLVLWAGKYFCKCPACAVKKE